jgi:flagellar protein FliL
MMAMIKDPKVLAGVAVLLLVGFWFFVKPMVMPAKAAPPPTAEQIAAAPKPTLTLEERVLNLKSPAAAPNYVKVSLALEFDDPKHTYLKLKGAAVTAANTVLTEEMKPDLPRVWDAVIKTVGAKSVDQVASTEGQDALKAELINTLNTELGPDRKVQRINFVVWITQ